MRSSPGLKELAPKEPPPYNVSGREVARLRRRLTSWGPTGMRPFPWRSVSDPYLRLLAEVLLQRTRAEMVAACWAAITSAFPTARHLATAEMGTIVDVIRPLGLANKRARYLRALGQQLVQIGSVPEDHDILVNLPGVGRYSAA